MQAVTSLMARVQTHSLGYRPKDDQLGEWIFIGMRSQTCFRHKGKWQDGETKAMLQLGVCNDEVVCAITPEAYFGLAMQEIALLMGQWQEGYGQTIEPNSYLGKFVKRNKLEVVQNG